MAPRQKGCLALYSKSYHLLHPTFHLHLSRLKNLEDVAVDSVLPISAYKKVKFWCETWCDISFFLARVPYSFNGFLVSHFRVQRIYCSKDQL
jgi:hypothetical protein